MPEPRTSHYTSNLEILSRDENKVVLRYNWLTKVGKARSGGEMEPTGTMGSFYLSASSVLPRR